METQPIDTGQNVTSLEKSVVLLKAAERCKIIEARLAILRSEVDMTITELRALQQQLQISPPLQADAQ